VGPQTFDPTILDPGAVRTIVDAVSHVFDSPSKDREPEIIHKDAWVVGGHP
jgi:hypothetical protein